MTVTDDVLARFQSVKGTPRLLAQRLKDEKSLEEIAQEVGLPLPQIGAILENTCAELGLPPVASLYAKQQQLAEVQRIFSLRQEEKMHGAPVASLPHRQATAHASEKTREPDTEDLEESHNDALHPPEGDSLPTPDPSGIAPKLLGLKPKWQETIGALAKVGDRELHKAAEQLGINRESFSLRLSNIYKALGIDHLGAWKAKSVLREAWALHIKLSAIPKVLPQARNPVAQVRPEVPPPLPQKVAPVPGAETSDGAGFGAGVLIPLPPDVSNIDVVSGLFNGGRPTLDMARALRERKEAGLKPAYLVLSPSAVDPATSLAQVVFYDKR